MKIKLFNYLFSQININKSFLTIIYSNSHKFEQTPTKEHTFGLI